MSAAIGFGFGSFAAAIAGHVNASEAAAPYDEWSLVTTYIRHSGLRQIPVAGPDGSPCRWVKEAAAWGQRIVQFAASRVGSIPDIPVIEPDSAAQKLLDFKISPAVPQVLPDSLNVRFIVTGVIVYGLTQPPDLTVGLPMGKAPFDTNAASNYVLKATNTKPTF